MKVSVSSVCLCFSCSFFPPPLAFLSALFLQKDGPDNFPLAHLKYYYCLRPVVSNVTADLHTGALQTFCFIQKVAHCAIALIVRSRYADND